MKRLLRNIIETMPRLALFLRNTRDALDRNDSPIKTPWGFVLAGNKSMALGKFEPEETHLVRILLAETDVMVNVGANIGYYCCHALNLGKRVIAFEPLARNLHYLMANVRNNGWADCIEIYSAALADKSGVCEIWGSDTGASLVRGWANIPESYKNLVPILTLDTVLAGRLQGNRTLVIADIEGAELEMLSGAGSLLQNDPKPVWLVEITTNENQPIQGSMNPDFLSVFNLFFDAGYKAYIANQSMKELSLEDVQLIASGNTIPGTHNYLFKAE